MLYIFIFCIFSITHYNTFNIIFTNTFYFKIISSIINITLINFVNIIPILSSGKILFILRLVHYLLIVNLDIFLRYYSLNID